MTVEETVTERDQTHGDFVTQAEAAKRMEQVLVNTQGWAQMPYWMRYSVSMILMKISRIVHGNCRTRDHWHDIGGYSHLVERELGDDS